MTNKQQPVGDKKQAKLRQRKSKSEARYKSRNSEDSTSDKPNVEQSSTPTWDTEEFDQQADNVGA